VSNRPDLLLTYDFPPMGGGIARMMSELALRTPRGELIVSTGQLPGSAPSDAALPNVIDRLAIPAGRLKTVQGLLRWGFRAESLARRHQVGFVWCGNIRPAAYPARWVRARCGVPYGVIVYGGDLLELRRNFRASSIKRRTARWLLGGADVIVAISRWTQRLACEVLEELSLGTHCGKVSVVPLGTDPDNFRPGLDPAALAAHYSLPRGRWLVTVARLVAHKGIDTTIQALALLQDRYPDLRYAVVGQGSYRPALEELARSIGVADRVHFLTDVSDRMLPLAYALADVYVGVSRQTEREVEGFGIALLEAQASGKPVVAGRSGGMPDAVKEGVTGALVDSENPADLAGAVSNFLEDPALAQTVGRAGRSAVESFYNWPRVVADLRALTAEARSAQRKLRRWDRR
jgi:phosphatidylinositol alpha-1,6-mannosyltransferase